jgi:TonB-linked SusC/RagA family outer membrane protein
MTIKVKSMRGALLLAFLLFVGSISAQTVKVNVKDSQGEAVIGASVLEQGTRNGGVTDFDGNFTINLSAGKPIVISYIGMKTKTVNAKGKSEIAVVMEDDATTLQEVVAIGYGSVRKKDLTGSVATVSSEALQAVPVANASEALTGKMAGVNITTTEGSPDAEVKIRVRGGGSITGDNTPLFIVDGFPVESISDIPASDIEDITVLKDASSTAIYGSRGANGVILVTTKSGKEGKVNVAYNVFYSWKKMAKKLNTLSASDYVNYQWEYAQLRDNEEKFTNLFGNYQDADLYANAPTNDWQDQVFGRTGHTFNHNLTISGGSDKTQFNFGYAHIYDKAIMIGSGFSRDNLSLKLKHKASKSISMDFNVRYANSTVYGAGANESKNEVSSADSRLKNVMIYPMFNFTDLSDGYDPDLQLTNPITSVYDTDRKQNRQTFNMNGSVTWEIIKDLKLKVELGLDWYYNTDQKYYGNSTYNARTNSVDADGTHPMAYFIDSKRQTYRNTNTLSYDFKKLLGKNSLHKLNVLLGEETINKRSSVNEDRLSHYPTSFTAEQTWSLSTQGTPYLVNKYINADDNLLSFFTRANYNYDDKYLISATFRADGSSKFAKDNRWGYFPSAAIAWRISSEPFMKSTEKWLDDLKLRLSYGTAGNNNIPSDQMAPVWSSSSSVWFNNFSSYWTTGEQASNPDLKWETTITRNIGLDFTLFRGAINGSVEYYYNTTKDLLINFPVSGSGYKYQYRNLGETQNKGVEVSLTWNAINKKNYGLTISGNIGFNKNEVVDLGSLTEYSASSGWASTTIQGDYVVKPGRPVGEIYGYKVAGRYEVSDFEDYTASGDKWVLKSGVASDASVIGSSYLRPGALKLEDTNGDGVVNSSDIDVIGDTNPTASGGFAINARAYGFDLSANFTYSIGNKVYNANKIEYTTSYQYYFRNMLDIMEAGERWTNLDPVTGLITNDATRLEELNANTTMWSPYTGNVLTDWAIEDGSFLRLATLTLGYTLPKNLIKRIGISNLRLYTTCYNVFCLTGYSGFDPEVSTRNKTALTPGVDYSAYPKSRQFVIGLNLNF